MVYKEGNLQNKENPNMLELAKEIIGTGPSGIIALLAFAAIGLAWKALSVLESEKKNKE